MTSIKFQKLVRSMQPSHIHEDGWVAETITYSNPFMKKRLLYAKINEELAELMIADMTGGDVTSELADLLECVRSLSEVFNVPLENLEKVALNKSLAKGTLATGLFLIAIHPPEEPTTNE